MQRMNFFGAILCAILIGGAVGNASFGQDYSKASERKLRADVARFTSEVKRGAGGAYLARFTIAARTTELYFVPKKSLWNKLSEAEKVRIVSDWWRRWRVIRGADDRRISTLTNAAQEVFCVLERCYVPECAL